MLELTDRERWSLRRYVSAGDCPGRYGYCNAMFTLAEVTPDPPPKDDPRWPTTCVCGYAFQDGDEWQVLRERIFARDTGEEYTLPDAPPGAIWDATWFPEKGPDGLSLVMRLPNGAGDWHIDGLCRDGTGSWSRTGTPPVITARPSVLTPHYHGFLTDGQLVSC